jgi:T5SS/PEP-CTERM-associated repeat protein
MRARDSVDGVLRVCAIVVLTGAVFPTAVRAQANSWSNSSGGYWDDFRNWSLRVRPTNSPSIFITNAPSKTVTIDGYTSGTYPDSMIISNLTLLGSGGTTNTLFLSNAGASTPLQVQNSLAILGGGVLLMTSSSLQVGGPAGGSFVLEGTAALSGTNSFSGGLYVGFFTNSAGSLSMADGQAGFTNGYTVVGFYGSGQVVLSNGTCQAGDDSSVPNGVFLGLASGSQGALSIIEGNYAAPEHVSLGEDAGSTGLVWISGGQLTLTNNFLLTIGGGGIGQMVLSNGAVLASDVEVANAPASQGALLLSGGTGNFSGALAMGVGLNATGTVSITGGQLAVTNRNVIVGNYGVGQLTVSNGALLAQTIIVGNCHGSQGTMAIAAGTVAVTNQSQTGHIVVGQQGNGLFIQNGGALTLDRLTIATGCASNIIAGTSTNVLGYASIGQVTLSNGAFLCQSAQIGVGTNSQGTLTIAGASVSITSNAVAGVMMNATGVIQVAGGDLTITNQTGSAQLVVGQAGGGTFTETSGDVTVDQLFVVNGANSIFSLSAGLFNSRSTTVSNAQAFVVGDGLGAATFHLLGGVHSFVDGLRIRSNSVLSGCGTINGSISVDAGGMMLADCGGTLTFTGIVTNNGSLKAVNGSVLESYGPVVNNGVINALDGSTNFPSGFINNGVVLCTDSVPHIVSISAVRPDLIVRFTTGNSPTYVLEYTDSLENQNWLPVIAVPGSGAIMSETDLGAAALSHRFYRVRLVVPP